MIQHGNRPNESAHLSNGNTSAGIAPIATQAELSSATCLVVLLLRVFVAALPHSVIGPV